MVVATAHSPEWASAWRTPDESGPNISRVMRTNFGDTTAKIFREYSDSLVHRLYLDLGVGKAYDSSSSHSFLIGSNGNVLGNLSFLT